VVIEEILKIFPKQYYYPIKNLVGTIGESNALFLRFPLL